MLRALWIAASVLMLSFKSGAVAADAETKEGIARTRDVVYGRKDGVALTMDVFRPAGKSNGAAVVACISKGYESSPEMIEPVYFQDLLDRGYTVFAVVPSSAPRFTVPEMRDDVRRAVRFIRYRAKEYGIEPKRIGASGASAGGLLALHLGAPASGEPDAKDPVEREDAQVQAVTALFPPTDSLNWGKVGNEPDYEKMLARFRAAHDFRIYDSVTGKYIHIQEEAKDSSWLYGAYAKAKLRSMYVGMSPIYSVTAKFAPTFLMHGSSDILVPLQQSESMLAKLKAAGVSAKLVTKPGAGHGWPKLKDDMPAISDWFDDHLRK